MMDHDEYDGVARWDNLLESLLDEDKDDAGDDSDEEGAACKSSSLEHHLFASSFAWGGERIR